MMQRVVLAVLLLGALLAMAGCARLSDLRCRTVECEMAAEENCWPADARSAMRPTRPF